jgi:hypothetical protein
MNLLNHIKKLQKERKRKEKGFFLTFLGAWRVNLVRRGASRLVWTLLIAFCIANISSLLLLCCSRGSQVLSFCFTTELGPDLE